MRTFLPASADCAIFGLWQSFPLLEFDLAQKPMLGRKIPALTQRNTIKLVCLRVDVRKRTLSVV